MDRVAEAAAGQGAAGQGADVVAAQAAEGQGADVVAAQAATGQAAAQAVGVGIIGDTGMVGTAIGRLIEGHGLARVAYRRNSRREEGLLKGCAICFLATADADSMRFAREALGSGARVVDMSGAFRLLVADFERWYGMEHSAPELVGEAVYGMPAFNAEAIRGARLVSNPGCFATAVILALRPLHPMLSGEAVVVATSGNSGARREIEAASNEIAYTFGRRHKHVPEMNKYSYFDIDFTAIVLRSVFSGINANIRVELPGSLRSMPPQSAAAELERRIGAAYKADDLVRVARDGERAGDVAPSDVGGAWGTRDVVGTNLLLIKVRVDGGFAYICSMLDNIVKGAAGQAIENMNLMLGFPRLQGLE